MNGMPTTEPSRRASIDWASVTSSCENDRTLRLVREAAQAAISDHCGYRDTAPLKSAGNYFEGFRWARFGGQMRWSTYTQAVITGAHHEGRCVGTCNVQMRGSTGIGPWPVAQSLGLLSSLRDLGFQRVPRLDIAVDVFDHPELSVTRIYDLIRAGVWRVPRRKPDSFHHHGPIVDSAKKKRGASVYLGNAGDDCQVIVYDKGAQMGSERPWLRIEVRYKHALAEEALWRLVDVQNGALRTALPDQALEKALLGLVKASFDVRDVSAFGSVAQLPQNWARSPKACTPALMHPIYDEVKPLDLAGYRVQGSFAARCRHMQRSGGLQLWRMSVLLMARGEDPGPVGLIAGGAYWDRLTDEDFAELSQISGRTVEELDLANTACVKRLAELQGWQLDDLASDRELLKKELLVRLGGV